MYPAKEITSLLLLGVLPVFFISHTLAPPFCRADPLLIKESLRLSGASSKNNYSIEIFYDRI